MERIWKEMIPGVCVRKGVEGQGMKVIYDRANELAIRLE